MATREVTGDGPGDGEHINTQGGPLSLTKSHGKAIQENTMASSSIDSALESQPDPKKNQPPKILLNLNVTQDHNPSKDKGGDRDMRNSNYGHDDMALNRQSSTSRHPGASRDGFGIVPFSNEHIIALGESSSSKKGLMEANPGTIVQTAGPDPTQPSLEVFDAIVAPSGPNPVQPNLGDVAASVVLASAAPAQSNVALLGALPSVAPADPNVGPIGALHGVAPAQPNAALIQPNVAPNIAPPALFLAQPNVAPNVAPLNVAPVQPNVAPPSVAPAELNVAPMVARNVAPLALAPAQPNVAPIIAPAPAPAPAPAQPNVPPVAPAQLNVVPPGVAPAQPNAAAIVALAGVPPAQPYAFDINRGLKSSRLRPLRTCEYGSEETFWPKL